MSSHHKNHSPLNKSNRIQATVRTHQSAITPTTTDRVVVFEAVSAARDIIRVSIETARAAAAPEQIIVF